ncbi:MAG: hypothetical protein E7B00_17725, partial [Citrobacter koseri]|nr:hypothetical protein [Klebsiella pneumoniae]MDU3233086.1 hypothetical protein [Citrobacter koseri]
IELFYPALVCAREVRRVQPGFQSAVLHRDPLSILYAYFAVDTTTHIAVRAGVHLRALLCVAAREGTFRNCLTIRAVFKGFLHFKPVVAP